MIKRLIIILAAGIFALVGILAFLVYPLSRGILSLSREFFIQQRELQTATVNLATAEEFESFEREFQRDMEKNSSLLIDPETPIPFVQFLENSARDSKLSLTVVPGSVRKQKNDPWFSLDFKVSGQGTYPGTFVFLKKLEYAPFVAELQNVIIEKAGPAFGAQESTQGNIKFSFGVKAYVKPPQARQ